MCSISGYIGAKNAVKILVKSLSNLEYRGYDSTGLGFVDGNNVSIIKNKGKVKNLNSECLGFYDKSINCGIGHTRWATHGVVNRANAHPHTSNNNICTLVHNGIVENYKELKIFLEEKGYKFNSDTDTEILTNLIEYYFIESSDILLSLQKVMFEIKGNSSFALILNQNLDKIYAVKMGPPIIVSKSDNHLKISSDILGLVDNKEPKNQNLDIYYLKDKEIAVLGKKKVLVYDDSLKLIDINFNKVNTQNISCNKGKFEHYMIKEIYDQPNCIQNILSQRLDKNDQINFLELNNISELLKTTKKIHILGSGSSYYAGLFSKCLCENIDNIEIVVKNSSEFKYKTKRFGKNDIVLVISQSGETADAIQALKEIKSYGIKIISFTNNYLSTISRLSDANIDLNCWPEISVASTKSFTAQVLLLNLFFDWLKNIRNTNLKMASNIKSIKSLPKQIDKFIKENDYLFRKISHYLTKFYNLFIIGRLHELPIAMEGALKLKEISYIHAEAISAGELKHGSLALIEKKFPSIFLCTNEMLFYKNLSSIREIEAREGLVIPIVLDKFKYEFKNYENLILIPDIDKLSSSMLIITSIQLLSYYIGLNKGNEIDTPRNLAKSVTVE